MSRRPAASETLAEVTLYHWIHQLEDSSPKPATITREDVVHAGGIPIRFLAHYPGEQGDFQASVFCVHQEVMLLRVAGKIKEEDANILLRVFEHHNPCSQAMRPQVILDLSEVPAVAYRARKNLILALHILRTRSQQVWITGSPIILALLDMHARMYPSVNKRIFPVASLMEAIQASTQALTSDDKPSLMSSHANGSHPADNEATQELRRLTHLRALLNSAPDPIFSMSLSGVLLETNESGRNFFRQFLGSDFPAGRRFSEAWPLFSDREWDQVLGRLQEGGNWKGETIFDYEGQTTYYQVSFTPIREDKGTMTGISLFLRDNTQARAAEADSRYQKELIDSISYSIQEGLFRSSPQRGIMFVNQAFVEMFGYDSIEEVLRLDPYDLYVDTRRRDDFVNIVKVQTSFINEEVHFRRKDGSTFWGLISSVKKVDKQGMVYHDGAIRDVTQLREAQQRIQEKNAELTKVNRELDSFVYRVSHDLRAPLVSLLGLVSIIRMEESEEKKGRYMELMEKSIHKLDSFILDIMNYSRNTRIQLSSEAVHLRAVAEEIIESLRYSQEGFLHIENFVPNDLMIHTDPQRLRPILNNLISNAIRYRDQEKPSQMVRIAAARLGDQVQIEVSDNGIGIAEEHQSQVFNMFFRASRQSEGSGIGLYIVQETVGKLRGQIRLRSQLGEGSTFTLVLPDHPELLPE